jgi:hypothetical protein
MFPYPWRQRVAWWRASGLAVPPGWTLTRAGTNATYFDSAGILQTAGANVARFGYNQATLALKGLMVEQASTNSCLQNRDFTNAAWTKTNCTAAKDQTGIDGAANSASSLTATGANGTALQAITLASAVKDGSFYLKRITGTGNIDITIDNGTTWTTKVLTTSWQRFDRTQTLANPTVGIRIVTNGDKIAVDYAGLEDGLSAPTSPILTAGAAATRNADVLTINPTGLLVDAQGFMALSYECIVAQVSSAVFTLATMYNTGGSFGVSGGNTYLFDTTALRVGPAIGAVPGTTYSAAATWGGSGCAIAVGGSVTSGLAFDGSLGVTNPLRIGDDAAGGAHQAMSMFLKSVALGKVMLQTGELAKVTS